MRTIIPLLTFGHERLFVKGQLWSEIPLMRDHYGWQENDQFRLATIF